MKYGFLGCGNMGGALARALANVTTDISISDRSGAAASIAEELSCTYTQTRMVVSDCDRIFLAVKPHQIPDLLQSFADDLKVRKPLLISMAAGISLDRIAQEIGDNIPVIRIMPNTPVAVSKGVIPYCCNAMVQERDLQDFLQDMRYAGFWDPLPETLMDAVSALSGSGPAYAYLFMEAMADGAVACGLPRAKALRYAAETLAGAAEMLIQTNLHPGQLKDAVCSPGGSTIAGIQALEKHGFRGAVMDCITAAYQKNKDLGKR